MSAGELHRKGAGDAGRQRSLRGRVASWLPHLLLLIPILGTIVFVQRFASPLPLTDEWFFLEAAIALENVDLVSSEGLVFDRIDYPKSFSGHCTIVPFLVYQPVEEWTRYDSRFLVYITVATFALQAWFFRRFVVTSSALALPIFVIMFSPSHYMELLWGWQFTMAFSIVFPVIGLVLVDRMPLTRSWLARAGWIAAGGVSCMLGVLSSAAGCLGFPCAALIVLLKPLGKLEKACWFVLFVLASLAVYVWFMRDPERSTSVSPIILLQIFTALGGTIWSSPVGLTEFGVDVRSVTGFLITASVVAVLARAVKIEQLWRLSLPASITAFGFLCLLSLSLARDYIGNWHLQLALAAVCGAYACGFVLWRADRSLFAAVPFFTLLACLVAGVFGWLAAFREHGPSYREYVSAIEVFAKEYLEHPELLQPTPPGPAFGAEMILFLSAHDHALFADSAPPGAERPLPPGARVFLGREETASEMTIGTSPRPRMLTVVLPPGTQARGVTAEIGGRRLLLRRIHGRHTGLDAASAPDAVCFSGLVLSRPLRGGSHDVRFSMFD